MKKGKEICLKYSLEFTPIDKEQIIGISENVKDLSLFPINGLRHLPKGQTSGWYIWSGDKFSDEDDFFKPLHVSHLKEWNSLIIKYLNLPPGSRFLIGENGFEDVWFDETLLIE